MSLYCSDRPKGMLGRSWSSLPFEITRMDVRRDINESVYRRLRSSNKSHSCLSTPQIFKGGQEYLNRTDREHGKIKSLPGDKRSAFIPGPQSRSNSGRR